MKKVFVTAARRTAIGGFGGSLKDTGAVELGTAVAAALLANPPVGAEDIDEVIFGNVLSAGLGQNPARQIALAAGVPLRVPAYTVNKVCASGMKAAQLGYQAIASGEAAAVLVGGSENMSRAPYLVKGARFGLKMNHAPMEDSMVRDGLWCAFGDYHMGMTAENLAERLGIPRRRQDEFAAASQAKAAAAAEAGEFRDEIVPVEVRERKQTIRFERDEHPRPGTTVEALGRLSPAFKTGGTVTAGNASGISDGAAALVLAGEDLLAARGAPPLAEVLGFAAVGVAPEVMGLGPCGAVRKVLERTRLSLDEIDIFEFNEAFAVQSLAVLDELRIDPAKVNVNGGAIALGHPIGASGARIMVTLLHAMRRRRLRTGLAALCVGGGMGMATVLRMPD